MALKSKRINPAQKTSLSEKNPQEIFMLSLGCPRNLVDSEILTGNLMQKGFKVIYELKKNCIAIVNTCGFIEDAKQESIATILELADLKKEGRIKQLIVTGCLSQRYSKDLLREIKEIDGIFGCSTFIKIGEYLEQKVQGKKILVEEKPNFLYDHKMPRSVMTESHSVYVKIQEGCMNFCSYCAIPVIRGKFRSRPMESIREEARVLKEKGAKEINLIGQDTTLYGVDKYKRKMLARLLKEIAPIMKNRWIRILYTHPAHYTKELIKMIRDEPSVCKYVDLPIQHINNKILKKMNRHITKKEIIFLIENLRKIPGLAIRTSVIVGFPGERKKDFKELEDFIRQTKFDRLGVFTYSREEDTKAYDFHGQIPPEEKKNRFEHIMKLQQGISEELNRKYLGKTLKVLIDEKDRTSEGQYIGRTEYDAPEVDGNVYVESKKWLTTGHFVDVKVNGFMEYDLKGVVYEPRK